MFKSFSMDLAGRKLTVEVGRVAAQASGAAFMHYGDTVVLPRQPRRPSQGRALISSLSVWNMRKNYTQ